MNRLMPQFTSLALALALVACPTTPATPDFTLALAPGSLSLAAGASGQTSLTLTPTNGFKAEVTPALEGSIVGTGASKVQGVYTPGTPTSGTVTINVGASVPAGTYPLTVRGTSGSLNHTASLTLSVTTGATPPPPPPPGAPTNPTGFTATAASSSGINLSWSAVASATGYALERKTGAGAYAPIATPSGASYADTGLSASTTYTYRLKAVNASGSSSGVEATATTQAAAPGGDFTLAPAPGTLSLAPGGNGNVTVTINRTGGFAGAVTLTLEGGVVGAGADQVSGSFAPNPANGGSSTLTLNVGASVVSGDYALTVRGVSGALDKTTSLTLTVTAPKTVLLVDDDISANNLNPSNPSATPSASDTIFKAALDALGVGYNVYVVPNNADGPSFDQIKDYQTVIWYTASQYGGIGNVRTVSSADEIVLAAFLDQGDRKAIIVSNEYLYGLGATGSTSFASFSNQFLNNYLGGVGGKSDVLNNVAFTASGVTGTVTAGMSFSVAKDAPITTYTDVVNPDSGTDALVTVQAKPDSGSVRAVAAATGRSSVGTAGTSKAIYVGFAFENIVDIGASSKKALLEKLLAY